MNGMKRYRGAWSFVFCVMAAAQVNAASDRWPGEVDPACVGIDAKRLSEIDSAVREAIDAKKCPGAVVLVTRFGQTVWWRPYGNRLIDDSAAAGDLASRESTTRFVDHASPSVAESATRSGATVEPMSRETVFDVASLTKVMATATSVTILIDRGQLALGDRVARYIPEFGQNGKESVTIEQLLRHRGGFIADNPIGEYQDGRLRAMENIYALAPVYPPGSKFLYTDVGYIVLAEIVERVTGQPIDVFARENVFSPLGMQDTMYRPDSFLRVRAAPAERRDGKWMRGDVHDPRAYLMGGVGGHAGLFSTAHDVAVFANMILNEGEFCGRRILSAGAVATMTSPGDTPAGQARGLGWDINTSFSSPRGDLFPLGSFGHTGFTGTSLWVDPTTETAVVILTNRVHPNGKGNVVQLRRQIATIVAGSILDAPWSQSGTTGETKSEKSAPGPASDGNSSTESKAATAAEHANRAADQPVLNGIDVLVRDNFRALKGRKVGLITNHTGVDRDARPTIDLLHEASGRADLDMKLVALFSPEHGIRGILDAPVADSQDEKTGLPIHSLYSKLRKPTAEQLAGIDTLVFDIQDIGCRFYTYSATLGLAMEAAAEHRLKFIVLDRPNAIGGERVEGPVLDSGSESFTGYHRIPVRHGMTLGELARMYNAERQIGADLEVVEVQGWRRAEHYDATGLLWINPSPNMRSLRQAELYPGIGLLETTNISVGRGTDTPFEVIGAPWLDGRRLADSLRSESLEGVVFVPVRFTPTASVHQKKECGGVQIIVTDRERFRPVRTGLAIARQLRVLYPNDWDPKSYNKLLANKAVFEAVTEARPVEEIENLYRADLEEFLKRRAPHLIYPAK